MEFELWSMIHWQIHDQCYLIKDGWGIIHFIIQSGLVNGVKKWNIDNTANGLKWSKMHKRRN